MPLGEQVLQRIRELPPAYQQEVLDFANFLRKKKPPKSPRRSLLGIWADMGFDISEEDIAQARQEMWGHFPRDIR
jgi:hypothetical protein